MTKINHRSYDVALIDAAKMLRDDCRTALSEKSTTERWCFIFWLLGPFILLVERTPSDFWLSFLAIAFLVRSFSNREFSWLKEGWVRLAFVFLLICLISALFSSDPLYSLGEAVAWFRFPLFAIATVFWLARDARFLYAMLFATAVGIIVMCGILAAEVVIVGHQNGRLSWPYQDLVPGNYLAKAGLPVTVVIVALTTSVANRVTLVGGIFVFGSMAMSVLTGERINLLIRLCGGLIAALVWRPRLVNTAVLALIAALTIYVALQLNPWIAERFVAAFIGQLPTDTHSPYFRTMLPGLMAFEQYPVLGVGTGMMRHVCLDLVGANSGLECHPHPHNFYIQLAAETGIFGVISGSIFMVAIIWACLKPRLQNTDNVVVATMWIVPFAFFWPIASTADFFGQWNNIFMWSAIAIALAGARIGTNDQSAQKAVFPDFVAQWKNVDAMPAYGKIRDSWETPTVTDAKKSIQTKFFTIGNQFWFKAIIVVLAIWAVYMIVSPYQNCIRDYPKRWAEKIIACSQISAF